MKIYPKALLVFGAFLAILLLAIQSDVGFAGVIAIIVLEILVFFGAAVFHRKRA
jgi:hypothetical protein